MKKIILPILLLSISFSVSEAQPLRKPSAGQIKKLIKKMITKNKVAFFVGLDSTDDSKCENIKINRLKILKIGRAKSNYYEQSGNYIDSDFMVKFTIQGSCNLTPPFRINENEYNEYKYHRNKHKPVMPMDLSGRVPFRSIPFEVQILTDDYGDWYASKYPYVFNKEDRPYTDKTKKYLKNLYYRKNGKKVKAWNKEQARLKSRMSDGAESGYHVMQFDHLYTREVKAMLEAQPKKTREFVYGSYWKLMEKDNRADTDRFLREVIKQLKAQKPRATRAKTSVRVNKVHSQNSLLGNRIR